MKKDPGTGVLRLILPDMIISPTRFVRRLVDPPKRLNLLDIVAGGNGTIGLRRERGIDPATGKQDHWFSLAECLGDRKYRRVTWSGFIDGVFVPDRSGSEVQLDSAGNTFDGFGSNAGKTIGSIWARAADVKPFDQERNRFDWVYSLGRGDEFMPERLGLLCLHANVGITFDLAALRKRFPAVRPNLFRATAGMGDSSRVHPEADPYSVDFWVFVDGRLHLSEYYNYSRSKSLPVCYMHTMEKDVPFYHRSGFRGFNYMHVTTARWGTKSQTNYQMARQLWDVNTKCEELWNDYFSRRYGPAAAEMRRFHESLEQMLSNVQLLKGWSPSLATKLNRNEKRLFVDPHLQYRRQPGVKNQGPTLVEMVASGEDCRKLIDEAMTKRLPERIMARLKEDERIFTYAEQTLRYFDQCVRAFQLGRAGRKDEARRHLAEARRVAKLLEKDTWSMALAYIHTEPFELNGFTSTYTTAALDHLAKLLEPLEEKATGDSP